MDIRSRLKTLVEKLPEQLGSRLCWVPFSFRLGKQYGHTAREIQQFSNYALIAKKCLIFNHVSSITNHAYHNIPFYKIFYDTCGFHPNMLHTFEDIKQIPIVTKEEFRKYHIEDRSTKTKGRMKINTGGTSGEPLEFYLDAHAFAREWAHMHTIWTSVGYRQCDLKLTFRGKNLGGIPIRYNPVHNEYMVNAYIDIEMVLDALSRITFKRKISFIHGFPSSVYNFACLCSERRPELLDKFKGSLRGVLLSSEYPAPIYRDKIEQVFQVPTISWYGHSEMAILAYEIDRFVYKPFQTYGFAEAVPDANGDFRLVGTSYYNTASPFIRYDTGDSIIPLDDREPLSAFRIKHGRIGDFILDQKGNRISLTALVFGRHHPIFGFVDFVQVAQEEAGHACIIITPSGDRHSDDTDWSRLFDYSNVNMEFNFISVNEPFRSPSGKVPLLIPYQTLRNELSGFDRSTSHGK